MTALARLVAVLGLCLGLAAGAEAKSPIERLIDDVEDQLEDMGFEVKEVSHTLLGRVRIVAEGNGVWREIILNPRTGELLRDYARQLDPGAAPGVPLLRRSRGDDDDGDDDD